MADFTNLHAAWRRARAGKRDDAAVLAFGYDLESNLIQLQNELIWEGWRPGPYEHFRVMEPKPRDIFAPAFRDRVLHHSLHAVLTPIFERVFHGRSYACRVNKGTHAGASKAQEIIRRTVRRYGVAFCLKADIRQYFASIDHAVLKELIRQQVECRKTLRLCDLIIDTSPGPAGAGIPLGNLTSQLFANIYLHEVDHYVANILQIPGYVRYMDDFLIVSRDVVALKEALPKIQAFLSKGLRLRLNSKTAIYRVAPHNGRAVDFLGYKIYATHRRLRRASVIKGRRYAAALAKDLNDHNLNRMTSWYAHARHAEPTGMMREVFRVLAEGGRS